LCKLKSRSNNLNKLNPSSGAKDNHTARLNIPPLCICQSAARREGGKQLCCRDPVGRDRGTRWARDYVCDSKRGVGNGCAGSSVAAGSPVGVGRNAPLQLLCLSLGAASSPPAWRFGACTVT